MSNSDLPIDPNEPVYCYCQQVSFGEMIACENEQVFNLFVLYITLLTRPKIV